MQYNKRNKRVNLGRFCHTTITFNAGLVRSLNVQTLIYRKELFSCLIKVAKILWVLMINMHYKWG